MALGDLSLLSIRDKTTWIERVVGQLRPQASAEDVINNTQFTVSVKPAGETSQGWFRRLLPRRARGISTRAPLTAVMNIIHDVQVFGTEAGVEAIGVPFPHIVFLLGSSSAEFRHATEERIAELLRQDWNDLIDPLVELRVRMLVGEDTGTGDIVGFFGRGVFAPRHNEKPVGRVDISVNGSASPEHPMLPGRIPAGLYRGQAALAFAAREQIAPAVSLLLPDCKFLLRGATALDPGISPLALECEVVDAASSTFRPLITAVEPPPRGYDAAFDVDCGDGNDLRIAVVQDDRPSRMLSSPPNENPYFEIVGIVAPQDRRDFVARRWWIDLDRDHNLVASAMRPRAMSIICEGNYVEGYDWNSSGRKASVQMRIVEAQAAGGSIPMLRAGSGALGYLRPPDVTAPVSFDEGWATSRSSAGMASFDLDWLDFAGAVESPSLYAERLAIHAGKVANGTVFIPGIEGRAASNATILCRRPNESVFAPNWNGDWEDGTEVIVGPLVLVVVNRGEA